MNLIPRASWGARPPRSTSRIGTVRGVAVHWEGPRMGTPSADKCADHVRAIQRFHMDAKGWSDIAYNFVVCPHGSVFEGRGWGNRSAANGTNLANAGYHAVCYLGGVGDAFTSAARLAIVAVVAESRRRYPAGREVRPHSSFRATACPGDEIRAWLATNPWTTPPPPAPPAPAPAPQEDDMLIAYVNGGAAYLISGGRKILLDGSEIDRLKAILPVVEAPRLIAATPDATVT